MGKKYLLIILMIILIIVVGCDNYIASNDELVKLDHLKTPDELEIWIPDLNKRNLELSITGLEINDLISKSNQLSNEEMKELEEKIDQYTIEVNELQNQIIRITNPEAIKDVFDKIRESKANYDKYLSEDLLRNANYYAVLLSYKDIDILTNSLEDGYIFSLLIFEDNTLVFFDKVFDGELESVEINAQFDYEWFYSQIEQGGK
ncbi:hypothetical protein Amet_1764 [Alkaliphilus metalliredigens QYMF]|uniref:Lipoprotein n=1 Tax=Alkaliphilus metalliredigens (strain QYMF) TaxID=293826 RepID=A6TP18_ALKMQ|nr:hypothetical protein [Alkaliphilus metalliredigens]ABR47936.1 hypothetical protein Amet_1764 [Alkaliphilus metalliredigens QYMF]